MKILFLCKRQYTNKDLLNDKYGRLWELPSRLCKSGVEVSGVCLSYRRIVTKDFHPPGDNNLPAWKSFNLYPDLFGYLKFLHFQFCKFAPDFIWVSSDCFHVIWGWLLSRVYRVPCVIDLYDNYEYFKLSKIPGITALYRFVLKRSEAIVCVSEPLRQWVLDNCRSQGELFIVGNGVDKKRFFPRSKRECRRHFNIAGDIKLIGTAGALTRTRGIHHLYRAFESLVEKNPNLYLAVAGPGERKDPIFAHANVFDLGVLPYSEMPLFINMLDVAVICNENNDFGRYCYPQKANEIFACRQSLVAANTGAMSDLLKPYPEYLYQPSTFIDLANKLQEQILTQSKLNLTVETWDSQAKKYLTIFRKLRLSSR